jgi:hypothetical protein
LTKHLSIPTDYPHGRTLHDGSGRYLTRSQVMPPPAGPFPPLPLFHPLPAPQLPIPQLPVPQMGNPGFFTPTTGNLPWASEALRNMASSQSAFRRIVPRNVDLENTGSGGVASGSAAAGATGARSKTSGSATSGGIASATSAASESVTSAATRSTASAAVRSALLRQ